MRRLEDESVGTVNHYSCLRGLAGKNCEIDSKTCPFAPDKRLRLAVASADACQKRDLRRRSRTVAPALNKKPLLFELGLPDVLGETDRLAGDSNFNQLLAERTVEGHLVEHHGISVPVGENKTVLKSLTCISNVQWISNRKSRSRIPHCKVCLPPRLMHLPGEEVDGDGGSYCGRPSTEGANPFSDARSLSSGTPFGPEQSEIGRIEKGKPAQKAGERQHYEFTPAHFPHGRGNSTIRAVLARAA